MSGIQYDKISNEENECFAVVNLGDFIGGPLSCQRWQNKATRAVEWGRGFGERVVLPVQIREESGEGLCPSSEILIYAVK